MREKIPYKNRVKKCMHPTTFYNTATDNCDAAAVFDSQVPFKRLYYIIIIFIMSNGCDAEELNQANNNEAASNKSCDVWSLICLQ